MKRHPVVFLGLLIGLLGLGACPAQQPASSSSAATVPAPAPRRAAVDLPARIFPAVEEEPRVATRFRGYGRPDPAPVNVRLALDQGARAQSLAYVLVHDLTWDPSIPRETRPGLATVRFAEPPTDLYVGYDPPAGFATWPLTPTRFVPVVSFWLPITEVSYADLQRIFRGEVADWAELGVLRPERIVPLSVRTDPPAPPLGPAGPPLTDTNALVAALAAAPGGIALLPVEQVDFRLRALRVDGHDPILEEGFAPGDPLVRTLSVALGPTSPVAVVERVGALVQKQQIAPPARAIEVVVVGDVMPGRLVGRRILAWGGDYTCPFAEVSGMLRQGDLTIANLEGALSDDIAPPSDPQTMLFVGAGAFGEGLRDAGIDGVSLANNHSRNFGSTGISATLALLQEAGIASFGAGMDLAAARQPALFTVKGVSFAFLGYDEVSDEYYGAEEGRAGTAPADPDMIVADIAAARQQADVVILYFHWGYEYTHQASEWQQQLAHRAIEAGADVVLGGHPHWVQGLERYRDTLIFYSLGNFVFDQKVSPETRQGVIARLIFRGQRLVNLRLQAVHIEDFFRPVPLSATDAEEVYSQIQEASPEWPHEKGAIP